MRKVLLGLLLSIAIAQFSAPNYQERQVYYHENENVCDHLGNEQISLKISVDGKATKELVAKTHTYCDIWGRKDGNRISIPSNWSYFDNANEIKFSEESSPYYYEDDLISIITKTTLLSPTKVEGKQYDCTINGNGEILHYGGDSGIKFDPPTISISCTTPAVSQ